jgi:hypothetical protein
VAKGRGGRRREAKKPKGGNKPVQSGATFLPLQLAAQKPPIKESSK